MSSPFSIFRTHQRGLMAALVLVSMFAFIVLGAAEQLFDVRGQGGASTKEVVATWSGGKFTEADIQRVALSRAALNHFAGAVRAQAASNAGVQNYESPRPYSTQDEEELINSVLLAEEGRKMGLTVPDSRVSNYIKNYLASVDVPNVGTRRDAVSKEQLLNIVRSIRISDQPVTFGQVQEAIRRELLIADTSRTLGVGQNFDYYATPAQQWEYFCRFNRRMKLQAYPVKVDAYLSDRRIPEPTDAQLAAFYDAHKETLQNSMSPEIGFRQPSRAKVEYIKADYVKFIDVARNSLTEKEIRDEFEKRKATFREALELHEEMTEPPAAEEEEKPDPNAIQAPEPGPTPYEEAIGAFAKTAPRATEPRFSDDEVFARNREKLVKSMAEQRARNLMAKALDDVYAKMVLFEERQWRPWVAANDEKPEAERAAAPTFDLAKLADPKSGLVYGQTGMYSYVDFTVDKNLSSTYVNRRWGKVKSETSGEEEEDIIENGTPLAVRAFESSARMHPERAEDAVTASGGDLHRNQYILWKVAAAAEHLPPFEEIREEVKRAWKLANDTGVSARELARKQAERHAEDANGQKKTLKELFADAPDVKETGEFVWYEANQVPTQFGAFHIGAPALVRLDEIEGEGFRFAREVMQLADRQAGAVMNDSGTIFYVVQPLDSPSSSLESLRTRFVREPYSEIRRGLSQFFNIPEEQGYVWASVGDMNRRYGEFLEQLQKRYELKWERPARRGQQS